MKERSAKLKLLRTAGFYKNTPAPLEHPFFPPLALGVLFSQLKKSGYDVSQDDLSIRAHCSLFDKRVNKRVRHELFFQKERILQYAKTGADEEIENELNALIGNDSADIFLLSVPESPYNPSNILFTIALARLLKKKYASHIVVGGDPVALGLLKSQYDVSGIIDYIVTGRGEKSVLDVVERILCSKDARKPDEVIEIQGAPYERIVVPDFSGIPLEKYRLSFLDYKDFSSRETLKDFFASGTSMLLFKFTEGCPNRCAFCSSSVERMGPILGPEEVVNSLYALQEQFSPTGYLFMSDTLNISRAYVQQICDLICARDMNILWSACARVNGLDEGVIAKMRQAGCIRLILGMETASPGLLGRTNKGITIQELEAALRLLSKYGIWSGVEIICGLPHETEEDVNTTIDFLVRNKEYIDMAYLAVFDLRDGSLMHAHPQDYGIENIRELNLYKREDSDASNITNFVKYGFDEAGGLRWPDKQKQMRDSFLRVQRAVHTVPYPNQFLREHLLFYLYSRCSDKNTIKRVFYENAPYIL